MEIFKTFALKISNERTMLFTNLADVVSFYLDSPKVQESLRSWACKRPDPSLVLITALPTKGPQQHLQKMKGARVTSLCPTWHSFTINHEYGLSSWRYDSYKALTNRSSAVYNSCNCRESPGIALQTLVCSL